MRKRRRASSSSGVRSSTAARASSGVTSTSPSRTQRRTAARPGSHEIPVNSMNMSLLKITELGRTMRSSSSIQTTVGTLVIAYVSLRVCSRSSRIGKVMPSAKGSMRSADSSRATAMTVKPVSASSSLRACHPGRS